MPNLQSFKASFKKFLIQNEGATAIEYALIAGGMALALAAIFGVAGKGGAFTTALGSLFTTITSQL